MTHPDNAVGAIPPGSTVMTAGTFSVPVPAKKPRRSTHWKAVAKAAEKLAADRLTELESLAPKHHAAIRRIRALHHQVIALVVALLVALVALVV